MDKKHVYIVVIFLAFFAGISSPLLAQRTGLVLSGGGAKGIAHIGVIRALEENGIPIDYITGTSMGAIIGGLYAAGYSTEEMEAIFLSDNFKEWMSGKIPNDEYYYFRKDDENGSWFSMDFDTKGGLTPDLPTNIVSPIQFDYMFMTIFSGADVACKNNFDSLFVPFRCIAADMVAEKGVPLRSGNLGQSIRASMTFPLYFRPIRIDSVLYFDGGIYNNFPSDVMMQDFQPEVVIGSKVAMDREPLEDDKLLSHLEYLVVRESNYDLMTDRGVLISPHVSNVSVTDFSHSKEFIQAGYDATIEKIDEIKSIVSKHVPREEVNERRFAFRANEPALIFDTVIVSGLTDNQKDFVISLLDRTSKRNNERTSFHDAKSAYFRVASDDKIKSVYPWATYDSTRNAYQWHIYAREKKDLSVEFGGNISSAAINQAFIQLKYSYFNKIITNVYANTYVGRFYNSGQIKFRQYYPTDFPFYVELSGTSNSWNYFKSRTYFFLDETPNYLIENENNLGLKLGIPVKVKYKFELGAYQAQETYKYYQISSGFTEYDTTDVTKFRPFVLKAELSSNNLNYKQFANEGSAFRLGLRFVSAKITTIPGSTSNSDEQISEKKMNYLIADLKYEKYFKLGKVFTLGLDGQAFFSTQGLLENYTASMLNAGRYYPTTHSMTMFIPSLRANQYVAAGIKGIFKIFKNIDFRVEGYVFQPYRTIERAGNSADQTAYFKPELSTPLKSNSYVVSAALVYQTPIGPASIAVNNYGENFKKPDFSIFTFNLGYTLFNQRALD